MKTLIIYKSNTGFTKEYAELLKPRIEADEIIEIKKFKRKMIKESTNLIYMGPLKNNVIDGLSKFLSNYKLMSDKNIFIFATGIEPITDDKKDKVIFANALQDYHVRLYLLPGGMDFSRFSKFKQFITNIVIKFASKSRPELGLIKDQHINYVNGYNLDRMVDVFYKVNKVVNY